jgi:hypothetical protein
LKSVRSPLMLTAAPVGHRKLRTKVSRSSLVQRVKVGWWVRLR